MDDRLPVDGDLIGYRYGPLEFDWEPRDLVLYALAVGADPGRDLPYVDLTRGPHPLPLFPLSRMARASRDSDGFSAIAVDHEHIYLANSATEIHRVVAPRGHASYSFEVIAVWDKVTSAILVAELTIEVDGEPVTTYRNSIIVQGGGNFGGDRGPSRRPLVEFTPDVEAGIDIPANSAAIYQLVGDHNPHSLDPDFAGQLGLPGPISAGQVVMGAAAVALTTNVADGDHSRLRELSVDYAGPHVVGQPLTLHAREASGEIAFTLHSGDQPVLAGGRAVLG